MPSSASAPNEIYSLSLHDALPILEGPIAGPWAAALSQTWGESAPSLDKRQLLDRKSTRLNSSHLGISYAVFCFGAQRDLLSFPTRRSSDLGRPDRRTMGCCAQPDLG